MNKETLYHLSYISDKTSTSNNYDLRHILSQSLKNNKINSITGLLVDYEKHFIQYLEGDSIKIFKLFERIKSDKRHKNVTLINYAKIDKRRFPRWEMKEKIITSEFTGQVSLEEIKSIITNPTSLSQEFFSRIMST